MQFTKLAILIPFFATAALANPVAEEAAPGQDVAAAELVGRDLQARGFGCPFNRNTCNTHCISLKGGRTGGYCAGKFRTTCTCVFG